MSKQSPFTPLGQCGQGSYGRVLMAVTNNYRELPLAVKIVSAFGQSFP